MMSSSLVMSSSLAHSLARSITQTGQPRFSVSWLGAVIETLALIGLVHGLVRDNDCCRLGTKARDRLVVLGVECLQRVYVAATAS